jgi:putative nucleotidyltransferase with HDIG domain
MLDPRDETLVEASRDRLTTALSRRDSWVSTVIAVSFLATTSLLAILAPVARELDPVLACVLVACYVAAWRIQFEIGTGSIVPTQLVLVPMFFLLPVAIVPLVVAFALLLDHLVGVARHETSFERGLLPLGNAWHAVGPALVLVAYGEQPASLDQWPVYVVALGAQFAFDFASSAARDWLALGLPPWEDVRYMLGVYAVDTALACIGLLAAIAASGAPYAFLLVVPLVALLTVFARERRRRLDSALELSHAYRGTALLLGDVVEADDSYTGTHCRDVVDLTLAVAEELGLDARERRDAEFAALLHDVGKIRIPNELINGSGPLSDEEREVMNQHTIHGEELLKRIGGLLAYVGTIVRHHHERWDGNGYPDGLRGHTIPRVARIIACCDAYNAMTTNRSYRPALPIKDALQELDRHAGTQFDPDVVRALTRVVRSQPRLSARGIPSSA